MLCVVNLTKIKKKKGLLSEVILNYEVSSSSSISFTTFCCFWLFQPISNSVFNVISVQLFTFIATHTHTHTHIIQPSYSWCNYEITTTNNTLSNQSTSILIIASLFYLFLRSVEVDTLPTSSKDICSNEIINKPKLNNHSPRKT